MTELLTRLWRVADDESRILNCDLSIVFDPIGLLLVRPPTRWEYDSTPANARTFAHTGGDGVHSSFLVQPGVSSPDDRSPIMMTVPAEGKHLIVGGSLLELLGLGCRTGYFWLEQLVHDLECTAAHLENPEVYTAEIWLEGSPTSQQRHLLSVLGKEFALSAWRCVTQRLAQLEQEYAALIC